MTLRDAVRPVYVPLWLRMIAVPFGMLIALPPVAHMIVHLWILVHNVLSATNLGATETGSDWARLAQIVVGSGIAFPDPVIGMILAWRRRRAERADTEEREAGR